LDKAARRALIRADAGELVRFAWPAILAR